MPGVSIHTATRSGPVSPAAPASARYFVAGQFERGPVNKPAVVRSLAELEVAFGGRVAWGFGYDDLRTFFEEGGAEAVVDRVAGPAATLGTLTLKDGAGVPANTLRVDANGPGPWSSGVTVEVAAGSKVGTYRLIVVGPDTRLGTVTETYDNLATSADAVDALAARSNFVRGVDLGGGPPAVHAAQALTAGVDDHAAVTASRLTAALADFGEEFGTGAVALPGYDATTVGAALLDHAQTHRRLALLAPAIGTDVNGVITVADGLIGDDAEYAGLFYPWIRIPMGGNASKLISPEGYVAACRTRAHTQVGPWRAPAGDIAVASFVAGVERPLDRATGEHLDEAHVSAIRTIAGGTRLYGWRSLSDDDENYALLVGRDVLNTVAYAAEAALEPYVFQTIDAKGQLLASVAGELLGLLEPLRVLGGLYENIDADGNELDPGYSVDVGPTVNTTAVLAANTVAAVIALRVSPVGELIDVTIVKAGLTASV